MPTTLRPLPPRLPRNGELPKLNTPPSVAAMAYPRPLGMPMMATAGLAHLTLRLGTSPK